ncbi:pentatricopeptide repeat protein [Arthroderma uncinatum]|uniref:pentatricopeptide repeat protein n=1 Tax=Arthroderma uncinatum TaxID=74035 RepID=UPI00144A8B0B|nr:pentatricopeptide repeat protein [Arthroderma uncinatum]KAF3482157.1 pentatricopeptide repeat protein [Arthroderma uncinatum]
MRRLTLQGARWHQHGLHKTCLPRRSPSFAVLPRPFSTTPKLYSGDGNQKIIVRNIEQSITNSKDNFEVDLESIERAEQNKVKERIKKLEDELKLVKDGFFAPDSEFMRSLSEEDRKRALEAVRKYAAEHNWKQEDERDEIMQKKLDAELDQVLQMELDKLEAEEEELWNPSKGLSGLEEPQEAEEAPEAPEAVEPEKEPYEVELKVPESHHAYVMRFNKALKTLAGTPTLAEKQYAWKSYRRCKEALPFFLDIAPEESIAMLWESQRPISEPSEKIPPRHLAILAEDILATGRILEAGQWVDYIDALRRDGLEEKALTLWREREPDLSQYTADEKKQYWNLGVRLFVANSKPKNAQDAAIIYLSLDPSHNARILIPVINCWAEGDGLENDARAWTLYLHLKTTLGADITMADYDEVSVGLLKSGKINLALAVFKDMMLTGQNSPAESDALYKASLGLVGKLHSDSINEADVNKVSLASLTILPRKFQNKFFYASWIKKLIGMREVDAAAKVVELMYERGVQPDAKHLNGLVGAWLREGSSAARQKAEGLGWSMIQKRVDRVWGNQPGSPSLQDAQPEGPIPAYMERIVPAGNIETFSILLLHYTRRDNDAMINYLVECLDKAQLRPNTFFANHLLYRELRKQNIAGVWSGYKNTMSTIRPDLETFACLWDCGKIQYDRTRSNFNAQFPSARALYSEMDRWYSNLPSHLQKDTQDAFSKDLYDHIIRCFCLSLDPQGTLVALRALKKTFGFFPDADTARILVFLVVRLIPIGDEATLPKRRHRRIASTPRAKENLQYVSKLLHRLREQKTLQAAKEGIYLDDMDQEFHMEFEVDLLCDLLRVVLRSMPRNPAKIEAGIQTAANEMGVGDLYLGEPPSYDV